MKHARDHDRFLKRLVENQIVAELRKDEPADLRVTRRSVADFSAEVGILRQKIGGIENGFANAARSVGIIERNVANNFVQIALGFWTEFCAAHRRRNSSVVLALYKSSKPSSSSRSSSG